MKRNFFGTTLIILGVLALLGAGGLLAHNLMEEKAAGESAKAVLQEIAPEIKISPTNPPQNEEIPGTLPPEIEIPNYMINPNMDMTEKEYDGRTYVGIVTIPALDVELPVLKDWSRSGAKIAPCRYEGTPYLDNLVICAHNYNSHFGRLNTLKTGDLVYFTDMDGNLFTYQIMTFEVLQANQSEEMCSGQWDLTLFTCTIGGRTRFTVRCEKI